MKRKLGLIFLMLLISVTAINVNMENPVNGDLRKAGFIASVSLITPDPGCRAFRGSLDILNTQGEIVSSNWISFRGVGPSGTEVFEETGQGLWSGYWDATEFGGGTYNVTMTVFEDCQGATQADMDYITMTLEPAREMEGIAGNLDRAGKITTSIIILVFGVDLAQVVNPNTATTLIDEFGGMSFALLLFGFVVPFVLSFAILYDMFFLVGFFRPNTARLIAFVIALLFSRANGFGALYSIFFTVFANFWISMLSLLFMMMVLYWVLGHLIWGYKFAQEINTQTSAMDYLDRVGRHLNKLETQK